MRTQSATKIDTAALGARSSESLGSRLRRDRFVVALAVIAVLGLALRVSYTLWMRDLIVLGDGLAYHFGAQYLVDGDGFINPLVRLSAGVDIQDATHPPAWTVVLAAPSALGLRSFLSHQLFTAVLGTATIVVTGLAGRAVMRPRTGLIAAALVAIYPNVWLYERELLSEPLAMLGVATILLLAYVFRRSPRALLAAGLGATAGVLAMTRSELILTAVLIVLPLILTATGVDWKRRFRWLVAAGVSCVVVIAPWALYNLTRFDRPVPLSTSLGPAMMQGNCTPTYEGELLAYYEFGCVIAVRNPSDDPSVAESQFREAALDFMGDRKRRVPVVAAARVGRTFNFFRPFQQVYLEAERGSETWVLRLALFSYWVLVPLAIAGAFVARRRHVVVYPLLVFPAIALLAVLPTIGAVRYRAPAEVSLVILAAITIDVAFEWWTRRRAPEVEPASTPAGLDSDEGAISVNP